MGRPKQASIVEVIRVAVAKRESTKDPAAGWYTYPDKGCHVYPQCLTCPLPKCWHEMTRKERAAMMRDVQAGIDLVAHRERVAVLDSLQGNLSKTCRTLGVNIYALKASIRAVEVAEMVSVGG